MHINRTLVLVAMTSCGAQMYAQTGGFTAMAPLRLASYNMQTRWQQEPDAKQSEAGGTASPAPKAGADHPWSFDVHLGYAIDPRTSGGTGSLPTSTTNSHTASDMLQPSFF